ncbi:Gfo/Idh/MocA family oxidoreductase [uncultured Maricaulis sp.]|uniref:Gfo/Idh/MocA family protein n=1 Tax=uncultured Maricaulis sp. TaxID=174710 RepID=UPI0030D83361|tara:strand:- start:1768 stop:2694 length:927 start_codon:yes stop_codon:yes gene_type:complete
MPNSKFLRAGVVGAGVFGGFHAGKYAADDRAQLVGIYDPDAQRARELAAKHGAKSFDTLAALIAACDAVTVASPAVNHFEAAAASLASGRHVLVEKPVASSVEEARELITLAAAHGCVLQVGHQERFVFNAMGLFQVPAAPKRIVARRMGPASDRNLDVSVTLDLMIHDLDLAIALAGAAVTKVEGKVDQGRFGHPDIAHAILTFENGCVAELSSSRVHHERDRKMRVEYAEGVVDVDFIAKTFENSTPFKLNPGFADTEMARDSLGANVKAFIASVLDGAPVAVPGIAGLRALDAARAVDGARVYGS